MRQAIFTKYLGPTNFRGSRVKAIAEAGSITIGWHDELSTDENHKLAAMTLAVKYGWDKYNSYVAGSIGKGIVFVAIEKRRRKK